jgi:signal transduction histidine kinase
LSLGLPGHLARAANSRALATAARWAGFACLAAAAANVLLSGLNAGMSPSSGVTLLMLVPMTVLLALLARRRTTLLTVAYLLVGTVCTYFYIVALFAGMPVYRDTCLFVAGLPVAAMTLVGGTGTGTLAGILWATLGFALADAAMVLGTAATGRTFQPDATSLGVYLFLIGVFAFDGVTRGARSKTQSALHRAVRDVRLVDLRRELLAGSTAEVHDTVLSELAAVANAEPGELSLRLRQRIEDDLWRITGPVAPHDGDESAPGGDPWYDSELRHAIEDARDEGLSVEFSGDRDILARLDDDTERALGLAVRQCLINVLRHSGSATAEVAVSGGGDAVSVMVVDAGSGFAPASTASDRLGFRQSVHDRIGRLGGTVTVYSSADVGTTVIMVLPTRETAA